MRGFSSIITAALFVLLMLSSACGGEEPTVPPTPAAVTPAPTTTPAHSETVQPTNTVEPTQLATVAPTAIAAPAASPQATAMPTPALTPTLEPTATATPRPTPTALPTATPVPKPSAAPARARYQLRGLESLLSWDSVGGATHYRVYYDDRPGSACNPGTDGTPGLCELLAGDVIATSYTHSEPGPSNNHYWVTACNSSGCSDIASDHPATAWSATEFMARQHVVDGNLNFYVRDDPDCTRDCEYNIYPGTGARDFGTVKKATGVDLGLMGPGKWSSMDWFRTRISNGTIANGRVVLTAEDIEAAHDNGEYAVMFYIQRRPAPEWQLGGDAATLRDWHRGGSGFYNLPTAVHDRTQRVLPSARGTAPTKETTGG